MNGRCASIAASRTFSIGAAGSVMGAAAWIRPPRTLRGILPHVVTVPLIQHQSFGHEDHEGHEGHEEGIHETRKTRSLLRKALLHFLHDLHALHVCLDLMPTRVTSPH